MAARYRCGSPRRRDSLQAQREISGIDFLEVLDRDLAGTALEDLRQQLLVVRLFHPPRTALDERNVSIRGGTSAFASAVAARTADRLAEDRRLARAEPAIATWLAGMTDADPEADRPSLLVVLTNSRGDFSSFTLALVKGADDPSPPPGIDPQLSEIAFSFKVECPSDFDCEQVPARPGVPSSDVSLDYLVKDYASFRQLMLDRLSTVLPDWRERSPADLGVALIEALAYAADHLSYHQDAVATEAYLTTARRRVSVRRHARLLDYPVHEGSNARAWVALEVRPSSLPVVVEGPGGGEPGTRFLTRFGIEEDVNVAIADLPAAIAAGAQVFESMQRLELHEPHNEISFYTWGDESCWLPRGATRATLRNPPAPPVARDADAGEPAADGEQDRGGARKLDALRPGHVLVLEEVATPPPDAATADRATGAGSPAPAGPEVIPSDTGSPMRRHPVRLTSVVPTTDPLFREPGGDDPLGVVEIEWDAEDALPVPLYVDRIPGAPGERTYTVARGNVVLVDHGRTVDRIEQRRIGVVSAARAYRPQLPLGPLTREARVRRFGAEREGGVETLVPVDEEASAAAAMRPEVGQEEPGVRVVDVTRAEVWTARRDLLGSDRFAPDFTVETESDGRARLRFGDGVNGRAPAAGSEFVARYRVGSGHVGNVGPGAIAHIVGAEAKPIVSVRNPMPAVGGLEPEPLERVRLNAPQAFRTQERAVTEADYAEVVERRPDVQRAVATRRWTGSWHTMFVTVDRRGGPGIDDEFERDLRQYLDRYRLTGYDVEVDAPTMVALHVAMTVCVRPGRFRAEAKLDLLQEFSNTVLPDGRRGFFHPDNFTFGTPVFLSQVVARAMALPSVLWIEVTRFGRLGEPPPAIDPESGVPLLADRVTAARLEILRLDNEPSAPERGRIEFDMKGGL